MHTDSAILGKVLVLFNYFEHVFKEQQDLHCRKELFCHIYIQYVAK